MADEEKSLLGRASTVLGVVAAACTLIYGGWTWIEGHFQSREEAKATERAIRRDLAWGTVRDFRRDATVARNRLNDCDIKKKKESLTSLEEAACNQYADDFRNAQADFDKALATARKISQD